MFIQKKLMLILLLQSFTMFGSQTMYVGKIQFPPCIECAPPMPSLLYKGGEHCVDVDKHDTRIPRRATYELYDDRVCCEFYILITEYLKRPNANDFAHLETSDQHPYAFYHVKRMSTIKTIVDEHQTGTSVPLNPGEKIEYWEITKMEKKDQDSSQDPSDTKDNNKNNEQLDKKDDARKNDPEMILPVLPDNTLIFLMNPTFVEVVTESWRPDDATVPLPTLKFRDEIDEKTLHAVGARMVCALLDFKCIHKKPTKTIAAIAQNRTITVQNPLNRYILNS